MTPFLLRARDKLKFKVIFPLCESNFMATTSRRFRPKLFSEVLGQEPVVQAFKNAIKSGRLAQAYLLSGERGTGKTTLARLIAKAINCTSLSEEGEPCNQCSSCIDITNGCSLDVIEIDGASHRGIDDVRLITEGIAFRSGPKTYKVIIVDEVHMLTKEAFNALLKTLEEPPPRSLFLFATTEAHKVLPTIISRCQRFQLQRIPRPLLIQKLTHIANELGMTVEPQALHRIADRAEGGMRDAESLFDQVAAFSEGKVTEKSVEEVFGLPPLEAYLRLDKAVSEGDFTYPFVLVEELYQSGKHLIHFFEGLVDHFRTIVKGMLQTQQHPAYRLEQALSLFSELVKRQDQFRQAHHPRIFLEETLLHIIRSRYLLPVDLLVKKLEALEKSHPQPAVVTSSQPVDLVEPIKADPAPKMQVPPVAGVEKPQIMVNAPRETHLFTAKEETLLQFAAVELEGVLKR